MKTCTKCGKSLSLDHFHINEGTRRVSKCRDCIKQRNEERVARLQHITPEAKPCSRCKKILPAASFSKSRRATTGLQSSCKACESDVGKKRGDNPRPDPTTTKRCAKCRQTLAASFFASSRHSKDGLKSWCRECSRLHRIVTKYKITIEQYLEMSKNGCQMPNCGSFDHLEVDHDHACCPSENTCGKCVRGVLCHSHNKGLGHFKDDPLDLLNAVEYLSSHKQTS